MGFRIISFLMLTVGLLTSPVQAEETPQWVHALAMHGDIKYGPDFSHFDYANPDAPKGGAIKLSALGATFDTFNPFTLKGIPASNSGALMFETLTVSSLDEPFTVYGLLAEKMRMPEDRSWVEYKLNPKARWHDGQPVTPQDVVFSFETLMEKGHPQFRFYYADVEKAEITGEDKVKFTFKNSENRELALTMGQLPILAKHDWEGKDFEKTTLTPPLGSGPYKVQSFEAGRNVIYERNPEYWGNDLPVQKGLYNFDEVRFDYYRDATVAVEAFKGGAFDYRYENIAKNWATAYNIPEVEEGKLLKLRKNHSVGSGMQAFVFNIRRDLFKDPRVRQALAYGFDFEWANENLFHGEYTRTKSYFANSELASSGLPEGRELEILEPYRGQIPPEVFNREYQPPTTDGSGRIRSNLKEAVSLLKAAGWGIQDGKLTHQETGDIFSFELLLLSPTWERIALPFKKNLERLGIDMRVRLVDTAQYKERTDTFDYDLVVDVFGQSQSPGNEQINYWHSSSADRPGSRNAIGIKNPVIDDLVQMVVNAPTREELVHRTRALDRVLLWNHYVIPNWHVKSARILTWNKFDMPEIYPKYSNGISYWRFWWEK